MPKRKVTTVHSLLFGEKVGELIEKLEADGFKPERCVIVALNDNELRVSSAMSRFEVLGSLVAACSAVEEDD